jgi:biotin synthase
MNPDLILNKEELSREDIIYLLNQDGEIKDDKLFKLANEVRLKYCGNDVRLRGIIELSNFCGQNCLYCAQREENSEIPRFKMKPEDVIETAHIIRNLGIFTIVMQAGEDYFYDTDMIAYIIYQIKQKTDVAITLSLGERGFDEYRAWRIAGADRYILKHETANPKLYPVYHGNQKLEERLEHLKFLKSIGYQIGSGNIVGLPMQTTEDIADDILLCKSLELDTAIFTPFVPFSNTPYRNHPAGNLELTLRTIAAARIVLKKVHIPAVTSITSLNEEGRIKGLNAGANMVMPDLTPSPVTEKNLAFTERKFVNDNSPNYKGSLQVQIESIGKKISESRGDALKLKEKAVIE